MSVVIRPATDADLNYIDHLQRKNAECLAFYPRSAFEREIPKQRIVMALIANDPCGYLYHGAFGPDLKIHQACIQYDARGYLYGAALVNWLRAIAESAGCLSLTLRCGSDISANGFWAAMGFYCVGVMPGGVRRMRDINCWRYDIHAPLFADRVTPSERQQDASLWRRKKDGAQSQFMRGRKLREYRRRLEEMDDAA